MTTLMQANRQWSSRPDDERFISLTEMESHFAAIRSQSRSVIVSNRAFSALPNEDNRGLAIVGPAGVAYNPSHWAFGQISALAEAPAGYLRTLPAPIAADAINYGLKYKRGIDEVGLLLQQNGSSTLRAATGPRYGRIWNSDIVSGLVSRFGDGVTGDWRVPGEFGKAVDVTRDNTTLYAGDRDMFVFLADEERRIEVPNRRHGESGSLARGFFVWNSEVGASTFGLGTFLFDYVCANRIVWGASEYKEIKIRHTAAAPDRWLEEVRPALQRYANGTSHTITAAIADARNDRIDDVDEFLAKRFGKKLSGQIAFTHLLEEDRPIENRWDVVTAVTAHAKSVVWQDERVELERRAGELLPLAA